MIVFTLHVLLLITGYLVLGYAFEAAVRRPRAGPTRAAILGSLLLVGWPALWLAILSGALIGRPLLPSLRDLTSTLLSRGGEYCLGAALGMACATWVGWTAFSLLRDAMHLRAIRHSALDLEALDDPAWEGLAELRVKLERKYRLSSHRERLSFRISDAIRTPFTTGIWRPDIYAPLWMFSEEAGSHLRLLLDREAALLSSGRAWPLAIFGLLGRLLPFAAPMIRGLRLALEGCADRAFLRRLPEGERPCFVEALRQIASVGRRGNPEAPLGRDPADLDTRIHQALDPTRRSWTRLSLLLSLATLFLAATAALGPIRFHTIQRLMARELPEGAIFLPYSADARAVAIPGRGGDLGDGILVDTTHMRNGRCHLDIPYWSWRPEFSGTRTPAFIRVRFDFEAIPASALAQGILFDSHVTLCREDSSGQVRELLTLDEDIRTLPAGHSHQEMVLALRGPEPFTGHKDLSGPSFRIPPGWRVKVTQLRAAPADPTEWAPRDLEAANRRIEDWRRLAGACHPLNLDWSRDE